VLSHAGLLLNTFIVVRQMQVRHVPFGVPFQMEISRIWPIKRIQFDRQATENAWFFALRAVAQLVARYTGGF
jgi:hypothetical protein